MTHLPKINNRFEIRARNGKDALIGQGGMGTVYYGIDTLTNAPVAIKLLKSDMIQRDREMVARFVREGEALRQLNHPNIVKMLDSAQVDNQHFLVMEYVPNGSLRDVLERTPRLSVQRALYISLDIADALTRAHRLDILHRDIKPDNVLIAEDGTPRLTDFGMARMGKTPHITQDGAIVGTLAYLPPEIFHGEQADERSDIWSFGVMLYEMLAGERPFPYDQPGALINAILTQSIMSLETLRPDVPIALIDLIYRMLTKDRHARINSVRLVGAELEALLRGGGAILLPAKVLVEDNRFDTDTPKPSSLPSSQRIAPNNLPTQPTAFIGREKELKDLETLLRSPETRLITLAGTGGIGKTRLALALAERHLRHYSDGVYFVALAGVDNPQHVIGATADAIGYSGAREDTNALLDYFRDKHLLLIMDNFEHVTGSATFLSDALQNAPQLQIIVTSRERLRLRGETVYDVDNLSVPTPYENAPETIKLYSSAQLFVQSARRLTPTFEIDNETAPDVANILRLVQGLPLAIELASAWLDAMPLPEIAQEIEKSLDFLETDLRDVPQRHRSIRAVFEYSWALMTPDERSMFAKLSVFRGGFERDAAEKVSGATLRTLTSLVNKSLLQRSPSGRYYVHKLLRQYAEERLDDTTKLEAHIAHASYYSAMLSRLASVINSSRESSSFDVMETELENLRLAWQFAIVSQRYEELTDSLDSAAAFYLGRGMLREGIELFKQLTDAMAMCGRGKEPLYYRAFNRMMWLCGRMGQYDTVIRESRKPYEFFKAQNNAAETAYALNALSYSSMMRGEYAESKRFASEAIELLPDISSVPMWFTAMGNYGYVLFLEGNLQEAKYIYESIFHTAKTMNIDYSPSGIAYMKNNLGEIVWGLGDAGYAQTLFKEAYDLFKQEKNLRGRAFTANNLAGTLYIQLKYDEASVLFQEAYRINKEIGDRYGLGHSLSALGNSVAVQGDHLKALEYFSQSLAVRRELGDLRGVADSLTDLSRTCLNLSRSQEALVYIDEAIEIRRKINDPAGLASALAGKTLAGMGAEFADEDIVALAKEAERLAIPTGDLLALAQAKMAQGIIALKRHQLEEAETTLTEALRLSKQINFMALSLMVVFGLGLLAEERGQDERALKLGAMAMRYPSHFFEMFSQHLEELFERLKTRLPVKLVTSTIEQTQVISPKDFIERILAGEI